MTFSPGDIVTLKSGGQALTIAAIDGEDATCIWLGEEGDLFREALPVIVLQAIDLNEDEQEDEDDSETDAEDEEEAAA